MIKKLLLLTIIFFGFFLNGNVFADEGGPNKQAYQQSLKEYNKQKDAYNEMVKYYDERIKNLKEEGKTDFVEAITQEKQRYIESESKNLESAKKELDTKLEAAIIERENDCANGSNGTEKGSCIDKKTFMFDTGSGFGIGPNFRGSNTSEGANVLLGTIIQKLMVALGVLSVLIMTVGGGYIILYHGQDELLSKGKSIFMSGIIALVIALSSYMIVGLLRFILYNN